MGIELTPNLNSRVPVVATPATNDRVLLVPSPVWASGRSQADTNKDGLLYIQNWTDNSGTSAPLTYSKMFGGRLTKTGQGNLDAFWASVIHSGVDEAGLFIGDVNGTAGGNLWGGHFRIQADTVAADMRGLLIELIPNLNVSSKVQFGCWVQNAVDANQLTAGFRSSGNFTRHIICYSDAAATAIIFDVDQAGAVRAAGAITPLTSGTLDIGATGARWRSVYANNLLLNGADSAGVSVGVSLTNRAVAPSRANTNGGTTYVESGRLMYQGTGGNGTTPVTVALSGAVPTPTVQTGAGTSATASVASTSNDDAGTVTVTLGTGPAAGSLVRLAFGANLAATPRAVTITPGTSGAAAANGYVTGAGSSGFTIATVNAPSGGIVFFYKVHA